MKKKTKTLVIILAIVAVLVAVYFFYKKKKNADTVGLDETEKGDTATSLAELDKSDTNSVIEHVIPAKHQDYVKGQVKWVKTYYADSTKNDSTWGKPSIDATARQYDVTIAQSMVIHASYGLENKGYLTHSEWEALRDKIVEL